VEPFRCTCKTKALSRRRFLQAGAGAAVAATAATSKLAAAPGDFPPSAQKPPPKPWWDALFERAEPIRYTGPALKHVALPLGGIGTGSIALHGSGRLVHWQIFNNISETCFVDDSFFLIRAQREGARPVVRALQQADIESIRGVPSVEFIGEYPFATIRYREPALPVEIVLEAFNPMIPLNAKDSAIPCAIFRFRLKNRTDETVSVSLLATLQNGVGHHFQGGSRGVWHSGYGGNMNRLVRRDGLTVISMSAEPGRPARLERPMTVLTDVPDALDAEHGPVENLTLVHVAEAPQSMRTRSQPRAYWLGGELTPAAAATLAAIERDVRQGAVLLLSSPSNQCMGRLEPGPADVKTRREQVVADFDGKDYGAWTVRGGGFGRKPARGTQPGQNTVRGWRGRGLVNTFRPDDTPCGVLTSPPFVIELPYMSFLIGGGKHPGRCCLNLKIDGKVVRSATGANRETLERKQWDVSEFLGKTAVLEIVDQESGGWGHILVDDIRLSNVPVGEPTSEEAKRWNAMLPAVFAPAGKRRQQTLVRLDPSERPFGSLPRAELNLLYAPGHEPIRLRRGARVVLRAEDGTPLLIEARHGKGMVWMLLADWPRPRNQDPASVRDTIMGLLAGMAQVGFQPASGRPKNAPSFGTMALATSHAAVSHRQAWTSRKDLLTDFAADGRLDPDPTPPQASPAGTTVNGALCASVSLGPGAETTVPFWITWCFPNQYYPQNAWTPSGRGVTFVGTMYSNWFEDALAVADYVHRNGERLYRQTRRYRDSLYESTLPYYLIDAFGANASIIRSPTCFWIQDGTFYGFEGCRFDGGGCCPMNCNHVWNYEQALAKLWPELERNMRVTELVYSQDPDGGVRHRVACPRQPKPAGPGPVADGQCGAVLKAYREHLQSASNRFLDEHWPRIRKAMEYAIRRWDQDEDGVFEAPQFNTYDQEVRGLSTFVGSLYLAALRAAERMATIQGDTDAAERYRRLFEKGSRTYDEKCFNGQYFIQVGGQEYGVGCLADQVVGQWWARLLDLGDVLPVEHVRSALASIFRYNWLTDHSRFQGTQRWRQFADGTDKGLLNCSWPKGGRPAEHHERHRYRPILYRDEVWTGVEYQVAAHSLWEHQLRQGLAIVKGARERYNGLKRNPWNEIECGNYYVRAMSSWSLLLAAQGYHYDGPAGRIRFEPRLGPENHRSFFTAAQGWGSFAQKRTARSQTNELRIDYGQCTLKSVGLKTARPRRSVRADVMLDGQRVAATVRTDGQDVAVDFAQPITIRQGQTLRISLGW